MHKRKLAYVAVAVSTTLMLLPAPRGAARTQLRDSAAADIQEGREIYEQKCAICHFSTSEEKKIGPGLEGLMKRGKFKNGMKASDENLRRVIERGGKDMPGYRDSLKAAQIQELIVYMKSL